MFLITFCLVDFLAPKEADKKWKISKEKESLFRLCNLLRIYRLEGNSKGPDYTVHSGSMLFANSTIFIGKLLKQNHARYIPNSYPKSIILK